MAVEFGPVVVDQVGLAVKLVIHPLAELVLLLPDEATVAIELRLRVLVVYDLAVVGKHVVGLRVFSPDTTELCGLIVLWTVLNAHDFLDPAYIYVRSYHFSKQHFEGKTL